MNDAQLVRCLLLLSGNIRNDVEQGALNDQKKAALAKLFDQILQQVVSRIQDKNFDFHKGNTLAALAEVLGQISEKAFYGVQYPQTECFNIDSAERRSASELGFRRSALTETYLAGTIMKCMKTLVPFYERYFESYSLNKKLTVVLAFEKSGLYSESLYAQLVDDVRAYLEEGPESERRLEVLQMSLLVTDPISNDQKDLFLELFKCLNTYARENQH